MLDLQDLDAAGAEHVADEAGGLVELAVEVLRGPG